MMSRVVDFDAAGRALRSEEAHHAMDALWRDPLTGGVIFVGNEVAAQGPLDALAHLGITHVVNATDDIVLLCCE